MGIGAMSSLMLTSPLTTLLLGSDGLAVTPLVTAAQKMTCIGPAEVVSG